MQRSLEEKKKRRMKLQKKVWQEDNLELARGQLRIRFQEDAYSPSSAPDETGMPEPPPFSFPPMSVPLASLHDDVQVDPEIAELFHPDPTPETHGRRVVPRIEERRASNATVAEPDAEATLVEPNLADEQQAFDQQAEEEVAQGIANCIAQNERMDGVSSQRTALNRARNRLVSTAPYVAEVFLSAEEEKLKKRRRRLPMITECTMHIGKCSKGTMSIGGKLSSIR